MIVPVPLDFATAPLYEQTFLDEKYVEMCEDIGSEYGICPELLMALIEEESSGNPDAENGSCKGLCQISEKWHTERMEQLGVTDIYDPAGNIELCADYLMELGAEYGDIGLVLMVYNGSSNAFELSEQGELTNYAEEILERSENLERLHGK